MVPNKHNLQAAQLKKVTKMQKKRKRKKKKTCAKKGEYKDGVKWKKLI